jgi:pyridoxal 5'-phosphate synthase pdxT subunit
LKIGVLAAQGAFAEHIQAFQKLKVDAVPIRLPGEIPDIDALVIPGGESTTISRLLIAYNLTRAIQDRVNNGMPVFGTCAGMVMLSNAVIDGDGVIPLNLIDICVRRNAFGRQVDSFETEIEIDSIGRPPFHGIFIRAPLIEKVGPQVEVIARLKDGTIVAARQGQILVSSFHPELTEDLRLHRYFLTFLSKK